ncbi:unnamed protein product [Ascophyllum nodosum]
MAMARRMRKPVSQHAPARLARWQLHLHLVARLAMLLLLSRIASTQETLEGTLMFLHVWKCGGTSMRKLLCSWAERENLPCATVATCKSLSLQEKKICLVNQKVIFPEVQGKFIAEQRVIAGHFRWGFQFYAAEPHLLITTLRNPLELYVSGQQYLNRDATRTLESAAMFVTNDMRKSLVRSPPSGFLHRFVGRSVITSQDVRQATVEGAANMKTFMLVGVIEQYVGFVSVLRALVDPSDKHAEMWDSYIEKRLNVSPVDSTNVLAEIDPELVDEFNSTLSYQWLVYGHAVRLFKERCREVLPQYLHLEHCSVPNPPSVYGA